MHELKLTYFDFNGGRGEAARLAMAIGEVPFEDDRIPVEQWPATKEKTPFGQLPVLEVDGETITQTNTINRLVGKLAGLYPDDLLEAARCDEVMSAIEDVMCRIVPTLFMQDEDEKRAAREALAEGPIPLFVQRIGEMLERRGGEYFADGRLTVADLKVFLWVRYLRSGMLDYVPTDIPDRLAPNLVAHFERISAHPAIVGWYEAH
ncbi:MAG: glutathione S-transferase family protein [Xanthomonadales bacterium]|nr:glutathione S-transferase family protein [Xanthomonadales bacterium]